MISPDPESHCSSVAGVAATGVVLLMIFTIAATAIFHRFWEKRDPLARNLSRITLLGNLAILGGLMLLLQNILAKA